jgi:hypothetical protein
VNQGAGQQGQVLVVGALLLAFFFVAISVFVIDTGLVEAGYQQLSETLQASAEDAANQVDIAALRSNAGSQPVLDAAAARVTADGSIAASQVPGLRSWSVKVSSDRVSVTATLAVRLFVLGTASLTETRAARLAYGQ